VSYVRLAVTLLFLAMLWLALFMKAIPGWLSIGPVLVFVVLVLYHDRLKRVESRAARAVAFYERGLERVEDRWQGKGNPGVSHGESPHLYAKDLDLFGQGSLFELLCTARTRSGEDTLAGWLRTPAPRAEILKRQQAVEELRNNVDLREDLALLGPDVRSTVKPEFITRWATASSRLSSQAVRVIAPILVAFTLVALIYREVFGGNTSFLYAALFLEAMLGLAFRRPVQEILYTIDEPARELAILGLALRRMEREKFSSARLLELQTNLAKDGKRPSQEIAFFIRLVDYLNQRRNQFFLIVSFFLLWATQFAFAIEAWRQRCGSDVGAWLERFGEFEALCALAGYAYEHPEAPFPEVVEGETILDGEDLRHPLLPRSSCVPNSVTLGSDLQLLLVSGSNMSGKSTLLRTVGINVVLAQAGGPVCAKRLKVCVLAIGATLRIQDSLQGGVSRFYAEIQRLHDIMELTSESLPVLFLLDEILHGTNSHDRVIGAEAIVRGLVARGAIGLVTTHDLALARVAESLAPRARNIHFEDNLENGRMIFDYRLHPGVVQKSNALELMRAVGLKV
jgi:MutS domain V